MIICKECTIRRSRGIATGQAFTRWRCKSCGAEDMHSNTGVPAVCQPCSKKLSLCMWCGNHVCRYCKARNKLDYCNDECHELAVRDNI